MKKNKFWKRILKMAKPHYRTIAIITILSLLINIGEIIKPYLIKITIDDYLNKGVFQNGTITIGMIGAMYIAIVILGNMIDFIAKTTTNLMGEQVVFDLRNKLYQFVQKANVSFHDKMPSGKLFVRITNDVEDISSLFKDVITTYLKDTILIFVIIAMMFYMSVQLSLIALLIVPFIILVSVIITTILNNLYEASKVIRTRVNTFLAESIYGIKLIKIFNRQKEKQQECEVLNTAFRDSRNMTGILEGLLPAILLIIENIGVSLIVWVGMENWFGVTVDVGLIYMFVSYIKKIFEPITNIIENIEVIQDAAVSINKIYEILEQEDCLENFEEGIILEKVQGKIEFKNVWFSYDDKTWVLRDISFTIEPGESIALVGKTGSGKTTIINLINRFYEIQKGEILLDGINIRDINLRCLRKHIGTVLQDPFIFARTIAENVKLNSNIAEEDIQESIKLASADEFVNSLPNGMHEMARERGSSYSAGQKQLLAFARIFAHNPSIFILDEATANIDTTTEKLVQKSIDIISAKKTSIFIAHRLATIVNVDKIIVLDTGKIIETGNHNELINTEGYYSKLYHSYYHSLAK